MVTSAEVPASAGVTDLSTSDSASPSGSTSLRIGLMARIRPGRVVTSSGTAVGVWFVAFGGALSFGRRAARIGSHRTILGGLVVWVFVLCFGYFLPEKQIAPFFLLAVAIGLVPGFATGGTRVVSSATRRTKVAIGDMVACALRQGGDVSCWGLAFYPLFGDGPGPLGSGPQELPRCVIGFCADPEEPGSGGGGGGSAPSDVPAVVDPPVVLPPKPPVGRVAVPQLRFTGRALVFTAYRVQRSGRSCPVSYTHLTLPTIQSV